MKTKYQVRFYLPPLGIDFGSEEIKQQFRAYVAKHEGARGQIAFLVPESRQMRKFLHGAVYPLWAYLNGMDHRDSEVIDWLHSEAKRMFNAHMEMLDGKATLRGLSTKGNLQPFIERVITYLEEQYAIDRTVNLDPEVYKDWRDRIYPDGGPDTFIDYMLSLGILHRPELADNH